MNDFKNIKLGVLTMRHLKKITPALSRLKKCLPISLLTIPSLTFADNAPIEFGAVKEKFQAITGDTALVFCVVGGLLAVAVWAAWKGSIKTLVTCLVCSGLVAKFNSVVGWMIKFFGGK